ncbi:unnamed protein product [Caenorhabditis bovis]|uniref:Uncharacterized protein n=1 Tax=Caenorhabditis bovis TaxID=2654633 RepID=A0A8S1ETN8_9PELO|nr:unnamed protein product [Caenorhabditis bovis]
MTTSRLPGCSSHHNIPMYYRARVGSQSEHRRLSQQSLPNPKLQALIDEWNNRERGTLYCDKQPSMYICPDDKLVKVLILEEGKETEFVSIVFPWFVASVECPADIKLNELKIALFKRLQFMKYEGYSFNAKDYVFRIITEISEMECVFNEDVYLCNAIDLSAPFPMLFLYEPDGLNHDKELCKNIGHCLGFPLESLEDVLDDELRQFRAWLFSITREACQSRGTEGYDHYAFPEEITMAVLSNNESEFAAKIRSTKLSYKLYYQTRFHETQRDVDNIQKITIPFDELDTPTILLWKFKEELKDKGIADPDDAEDEELLFQLAGKKSYMLPSDIPLIRYKVVKSAFEGHQCPTFIIRRKALVMRDFPKPKTVHVPNYVKAQERKIALDGLSISLENNPKELFKKSKPVDDDLVLSDFRAAMMWTLWDVDANLSFRAVSLSNVAFPDPFGQTAVEFRVYCGETVLVEKLSKQVYAANAKWNKDFIESDLYMKDMPPSAVLGLRVLFWKNPKKKAEFVEIGWVNISLTDWRDELRQGEVTLHLWAPEKNANRARIGDNGARIGLNCELTIEIKHFQARVRMPSRKQYENYMEEKFKWQELDFSMPADYENDKDHEKLISYISLFESGGKLNDEQEHFIWKWRKYISQKRPDNLTVISELHMIWKQREYFTELYMMLETWQRLSVGAALTLLGKRCTDRVLRKFAVEQLDSLLDTTQFPFYILPLIQALKYEPRAQSDVGRLLLQKALSDYRVGHKLFWLLRAEIAGLRNLNRDVQAKSEEFRRIALLIEAYLRGNEDHIKMMIRQVDMVELLSKFSVMVKSFPKDAATRKLQKELRDNYAKMQYMDSPLDPTYILGELVIDKCKVLGSAKMPLRLAWKNLNPMSEFHQPVYEILFKNGDDLRQDMLVLQVLEVMDNIWKKNDFDCSLSPYPVLPMGTKIGIIGVVPNCATIFEIQSEGGKMGTVSKSLETSFINKFIRHHSRDSKDFCSYLECSERFTWSCIGYSVATFIMGIKDRHSDNIMLTYDGRIFHIDFGHILGHGKTKLGIQRDRQPFVLTEHFLCVIRKGKPVDKDSHEVKKFRENCIKAYLYLWEERNLFESLFTLMQGMELPELSTEADLGHIKKTLCVGTEKEEVAEKYFTGIFEDAFNGSWSTKTNWFFHAVKHL